MRSNFEVVLFRVRRYHNIRFGHTRVGKQSSRELWERNVKSVQSCYDVKTVYGTFKNVDPKTKDWLENRLLIEGKGSREEEDLREMVRVEKDPQKYLWVGRRG